MGGNWIKGAIGKPGALHEQLGIPRGQKIPQGTLQSAAKAKGKLGKRARLAITLEGFHGGGGEMSRGQAASSAATRLMAAKARGGPREIGAQRKAMSRSKRIRVRRGAKKAPGEIALERRRGSGPKSPAEARMERARGLNPYAKGVD